MSHTPRRAGEFTLEIEPAKGTASFRQQGLYAPRTFAEEGSTMTNPAGTIQAVTTEALLPGVGGCPSGPNCFTVEVTNFTGVDLGGVFMAIDSISPATGRALVGSDAVPSGVSATGGRAFGDLVDGQTSLPTGVDITIPDNSHYVVRGTFWGDAPALGCSDLHVQSPALPDGVYTIDPDGPGGNAPFDVYCDMTTNGGGWTLVGKLGEATPFTSKNTFEADRNTGELLDFAPGTNNIQSNFDLARFDAYGRTWTLRTQTDSFNDLSHFQYTFFRPSDGNTVLPSEAGSNWLIPMTSPVSRLVHLTMSTNAGLSNTTWLPVQGWDVTGGQTIALFGHRVEALGSGQCLGAGQTVICHSPSGPIQNQSTGLLGTYTAAFSQEDAVPHQHGHRSWYWLKEVNVAGTP